MDEPTRIMTLEKPAAPVAEEPTRVITLEKPAGAACGEPPEEPAPQPVKNAACPCRNARWARRVLISGGDRGIGAAAARAFYAAAGYQVAVLYHQNAAAAAALEQQLPGMHRHPVRGSQPGQLRAGVPHRRSRPWGRVDVLVCNAGIAQQKLFTDITPEEWQRMLDVNLSGAFHLCQLALPGMIRRKAGPHPDGEQYVGPDRRQLRSALFRRQGGPHRPDQGTGQRRRPQRHHGELCGTRGH